MKGSAVSSRATLLLRNYQLAHNYCRSPSRDADIFLDPKYTIKIAKCVVGIILQIDQSTTTSFGDQLLFAVGLVWSRANISQIETLNIHRSAFLNYIKFVD